MTDLINMTKAQINALLAAPLSASQLKKKSHADLVAMFDAMPAADALDADLCDARSDEPTPTDIPIQPEPTADELTLQKVLDTMTDLEKRVVVAHLDAGIDCNGSDSLDAMRADNMTFADVAEIAQRTALSKNQVKGVISSLSSKGLLSTDNEKPNGQPGVDQVLTDFGIIVAFELLADGIEATAPEAVATVKPAPAPKKEKAAPKAVAPKPAPKTRVVEDRILTQPATDLKFVKPTNEGSKRHLLAQALERGATIEHLVEVLGWNKSTVTSALRWDLQQMGLGCERKGDKYFLILPVGVKSIPVRSKDVTRAEALVSACR